MRPKYSVYENSKYEKWVRSKPCLICEAPEVHGHHVDHARSNSYMLVPLCPTHHTFGKDAYHVIERKRFEDAHSINLDWFMINQLCDYIEEMK